MIYFLVSVLVVATAVAIALVLQAERRASVQLIAILTAERDAARLEAKAWLGLLCPVTKKTDAVSEDTRNVPSGTLGEGSTVQRRVSPQAANPVIDPRLPFRKRFNLQRRALNTPQKKTDALASALAQQKVPSPQEKTHV